MAQLAEHLTLDCSSGHDQGGRIESASGSALSVESASDSFILSLSLSLSPPPPAHSL